DLIPTGRRGAGVDEQGCLLSSCTVLNGAGGSNPPLSATFTQHYERGKRMGPPFSFQELMVIFVIVLILFGGHKLPQLGETFGKSVAEFSRALQQRQNIWEEEDRSEKTTGPLTLAAFILTLAFLTLILIWLKATT